MTDPHHNMWAATALTPRLPPAERRAVITVLDLIRFVIGMIGLFGVTMLGAALLLGPKIAEYQDFTRVPAALQLEILGGFYIAMSGILLFAVKWGRDSVWAPLRLDIAPGKWLILGPLLVLAVSVALSLGAVQLYERLSGTELHLDIDDFMRQGIEGPYLTAGTLLVAAVIGPVAEELLFRGLVLGWLQRFMPFWVAALISSFLFGLAHGQAAHIILAGVLGLAFAFIYRRAGSLWAPIAAHIANNFLAVISVYFDF